MKAPRLFRSKPKFAAYAKASLLAGAAAAPVSALADFSGPYSVNPPANNTFTFGAANGAFGNWTGTWSNNGQVNLNTGSAPSSITMSVGDSGSINPTATYSFLVTAAATGLVSFNFSTSLTVTGGSILFQDITTASSSPLSGSSSFSTSVNAGDIFGFKLTANYRGSVGLTVSNFSGPLRPSGVPDEGSTLALFALGFVGVMAYRTAAQRRAVARV